MPINWKKKSKFKPEIILNKICSVREINPQGGATYTGFELEDCLPALHSMLDLPPTAAEVDTADLVWRGLTEIGAELNPKSFIEFLNKELSNALSTKEKTYIFLTSISLDMRDIPQRLSVNGATIQFFQNTFPSRFKARDELLKQYTDEKQDDSLYCKLIIKTIAKSPNGAVSQSLQSLDLQRSLWCLMGNPRMQLFINDKQFRAPINFARLGHLHTLHYEDGKPAANQIWYEPDFIEAPIYRIPKPETIKKNSRWALRQIKDCRYGKILTSALIRYVRALDEKNPNTAFLRLWGAVEELTLPDKTRADYDRLVQRCAFLFDETEYHLQLLEHLREYRNGYVHSGDESKRAKTHCFQLQLYFVNLIWFHLHYAKFFNSLQEASLFLDLPSDLKTLKRNQQLIHKAIQFRT